MSETNIKIGYDVENKNICPFNLFCISSSQVQHEEGSFQLTLKILPELVYISLKNVRKFPLRLKIGSKRLPTR